jgi:hypothetical protein
MPSISKTDINHWKYVHPEILKNMKTTEKEFDAVKFMRQQRDRLSAQLSKMTKPEIVAYFRKKATETTIRPAGQ